MVGKYAVGGAYRVGARRLGITFGDHQGLVTNRLAPFRLGKTLEIHQGLATNRLAPFRLGKAWLVGDGGEATGDEAFLRGHGYARLPRPYNGWVVGVGIRGHNRCPLLTPLGKCGNQLYSRPHSENWQLPGKNLPQ